MRLSTELEALQTQWQSLHRKEQEELYAEQFAPLFVPLFATLPLHGAPPGLEKPKALVSVLGLSWQPVALMAAWAQPERMLVIGTNKSFEAAVGGVGVLTVISQLSGVPLERIEHALVEEPAEAEVYRAVRDFLRRVRSAARGVFVDPTGGKKSLSASAALAGFLEGAPLAYIDYAEYDDVKRIPIAGSEYPRLLANPLSVLGDLELRDILSAFRRSDFVEAAHLADKLALRLYEPREAECLGQLSAGYGAWDSFRFAEARRCLGKASDLLERFAARGKWSWAGDVQSTLTRNLRALEMLSPLGDKHRVQSIEEGRILPVWYLAAAERLLHGEKPSLAVLLTYAAVERYVDLCLWVDHGLDDKEPDYDRIKHKLDEQKYEEAGKRLFGKNYKPQELSGPLMFSNGVQLLAAVSPERLDPKSLGPLQGLASARNKCHYEHGLAPEVPKPNSVNRFIEHAADIASRAFDSIDDFNAARRDCQFPMPTLHEPQVGDGGSR